MSKKDYERAATIAQKYPAGTIDEEDGMTRDNFRGAVVGAFVELFAGDNGRFDADRFRRACQPGANVRARRAAA